MKPTNTARAALLLGALWALHSGAQDVSVPPAHAAVRIESLGQPLLARYAAGKWQYARNIWDMRLHGGRLYVGGGNSSNKGPAANAGPVPITAYDFERSEWVSEGQVDDEQIDRFVEIDGTLAIPGHDPKQPWQWGNLYIRSGAGIWRKQRRIPNGVHTYDVMSHAGRWFAALGTAKGGAVVETTDRGATWETTYLAPVRVYRLVSPGSRLFAFPALRIRNHIVQDNLLEWQDGQWRPMPTAAHLSWLPETPLKSNGELKLQSAERFGNRVAYIAAYARNDHQFDPIASYVGGLDPEGRWHAKRLNWPTGFAPWDVVVRDGQVHWLLNRPTRQGADVQVWRSSTEHPLQVVQTLAFSAPTLARALEVRGEDHFVALGAEVNEQADTIPDPLPAETGTVWHVRRH